MRPSLRTASPLGTDCESEAVGLMPSINETDGSLHLIGIRNPYWAITCPYWAITCQYSKCPSLPHVFARNAFVQRAEAR